MNSLVLLLSFGIAYFMWSSGSGFLAVLVLLIGALLSISEGSSAPSSGGGSVSSGGSPITVQGGSIPSEMKIQIQPNWSGGSTGHELIGKRLGSLASFFIKLVKAIASLFYKRN